MWLIIFLHYALNRFQCYNSKYFIFVYPSFAWFTVWVFHIFLKCFIYYFIFFVFQKKNRAYLLEALITQTEKQILCSNRKPVRQTLKMFSLNINFILCFWNFQIIIDLMQLGFFWYHQKFYEKKCKSFK